MRFVACFVLLKHYPIPLRFPFGLSLVQFWLFLCCLFLKKKIKKKEKKERKHHKKEHAKLAQTKDLTNQGVCGIMAMWLKLKGKSVLSTVQVSSHPLVQQAISGTF